MTLNQLRSFVLAFRTGSFSGAARELGVAQASISELIKRLEEENGMALFIRSGRRLTLTTAGAELLPFAEQSVAAADAGAQAVRSLRWLSGGVATLGVLRNADYYLLSDLVQTFHSRYPDVRVRLVGQNSVEVAAAVAAGELEAGIVVLPVDVEGLIVKPLLRDEVLYATSDPLRPSGPVTIDYVATAPLILYDAHYGWDDPHRRQLLARAQLAGLKLEPMIEVEHDESALRLVARGLGDTIVPRAVASQVADLEGVRLLPFAEPMTDTIALVHRQTTVLSPATREIVTLAEEMLATNDQASRSYVARGHRSSGRRVRQKR
jgi:DNA-binding transcriptional LysR family regulator